MDRLPNCVLSNIFIRLKAKQLAQMRTISKPWNTLLSESSFINHHLRHSLHHNDAILLIFPRSYFSFFGKPFKLRSSRCPILELANFIKLPVKPQSKKRRGKIIGSVNGLICFEYHKSAAIYIWNPSLSALLTLPPSPTPSSIWTDFRLGFDPTHDDYKVVKVTGIPFPNRDGIAEWLQVEVYSMRKGTWEIITEEVPSHLTEMLDQDLVCADGHNGHLHWLASVTNETASQRILAFDLGPQTFREMPLPDSLLDDMISNDLGVLNGKLCVMSSFRAIGSRKLEVWVMNEYGLSESWVKLHVISPCDINPCGFVSQNQFIFQDLNDGYALYDATTATTRFFKLRGRYKRIGKVVRYVESLVWVSRARCHSISLFRF